MPPHIKYFFEKWARIKRAKPEDAICVEICSNLRTIAIQGLLDCVFFHVENEGSSKRSHQLNLLKKACGKIPGVSDYIFMRGGKNLAIEIKAQDGKQHKAQEHFEEWCKEHGVPYYICRSWGDVKYILLKEGFIRNE